tara:strand:+ start:1067 stop:1915 length:849 start_codon:yes stop_codon:yes gene_type:complete
MGIGIVLNQLASMSSALSGISSTMSALGSVASSIGAALGKAFAFAKDKAVEAFESIQEAFEPLTSAIVGIWNAVVMPIWDLMEEGMMFWVNIFTGEWGKALENIKTMWNSTWGKLLNGLISAGNNALSGVQKIVRLYLGLVNAIWDRTWGKLWDGLANSAQKVFDRIGGGWEILTGAMQAIYDRTLGPMFDTIGGALGGLLNLHNSVIGGAKDLIPGGGGGSTTSVGTAISGGLTNAFNMTFNLSGMTDATDKRAMAREIGGLIQQELSRSSGGARTRGRYS